MIKRYFLLFFLLFCFINSSQANKTLDNFFHTTQSLQADFHQSIKNTYGKVLEQSTGHLTLNRPDKFILDYTSPIEQKYISNGSTIWIYDVELEQVSIKELDENIGDSPALLLSSNTNVYKYYLVTDIRLKETDDYQWIQLLAKNEDMNFERVLLAFKGTTLMQMIMYDSFGQITDLKFSNIQLNNSSSLQQFNFIPPDGVDVIGNTRAQ